MITLKVEEYCHECPNFEAEVKKLSGIDSNGNVPMVTVVMCEHSNRCSAMKRYLEKCIKKEK